MARIASEGWKAYCSLSTEVESWRKLVLCMLFRRAYNQYFFNYIVEFAFTVLLLKKFCFHFFTFPSAGSAVFSIFHSFFRNHKNVRLAFHSGIHFVKATALIEPRKKRKFVARATFLCHFKKSCCASFLPLAS